MSDNIVNKKILLVGSGPMSQAYAKVLGALNVQFDVVGRGQESAAAFEAATGVRPVIGGLSAFIDTHAATAYTGAIIATGTEMLKETTLQLAQWGIKEVLVEKPGAKSIEDAVALYAAMEHHKTQVFIAYNRRFYASVQRLREIIAEDGGVSSFNFEFTEWSHVITPLQKAEGVKENWLFANSTHVIDLAFYLGGAPAAMSSYTADRLPWHPVAIFAGSGITENGGLFAYQANWKAPGRWGVEILTARHRLYLKPLEKLQIQKLGSVQVEDFPIEDSLDTQFKPGLYNQTKAFIFGEFDKLVTLSEHIKNCTYYTQILTGGKF
ncbi:MULTISPECIES: Gfo/Idh/MocA family protein [unclassified Chitinophaga]|uniref:Gfo/Idh/MocA family protein n=1 Tax=unclassified Chitinophaga TaxID=2619133 RepID=UPI0030100833